MSEVDELVTPVDCPRGCGTLENCDEPGPDCSVAPAAAGERFGAGVCSGACAEPCGPNGGCVR